MSCAILTVVCTVHESADHCNKDQSRQEARQAGSDLARRRRCRCAFRCFCRGVLSHGTLSEVGTAVILLLVSAICVVTPRRRVCHAALQGARLRHYFVLLRKRPRPRSIAHTSRRAEVTFGPISESPEVLIKTNSRLNEQFAQTSGIHPCHVDSL